MLIPVPHTRFPFLPPFPLLRTCTTHTHTTYAPFQVSEHAFFKGVPFSEMIAGELAPAPPPFISSSTSLEESATGSSVDGDVLTTAGWSTFERSAESETKEGMQEHVVVASSTAATIGESMLSLVHLLWRQNPIGGGDSQDWAELYVCRASNPRLREGASFAVSCFVTPPPSLPLGKDSLIFF